MNTRLTRHDPAAGLRFRLRWILRIRRALATLTAGRLAPVLLPAQLQIQAEIRRRFK